MHTKKENNNNNLKMKKNTRINIIKENKKPYTQHTYTLQNKKYISVI